MNAEILSIGTELVLGDIVNTNAQYLSKQLALKGINVFYQSSVGDNPERIIKALSIAVTRSNLIIFTGGLGPTADDITVATVSNALGIPLEKNEEAYSHIVRYFERNGRTLTKNNEKQAYLPKGCTILPNEQGTAPGCVIESGNQSIVFLPGPPKELQVMYENYLSKYLDKFSSGIIKSKFVHIYGVGEAMIDSKAAELIKGTNPTVAPYAKDGEAELRVTAKSNNGAEAQKMIDETLIKIQALFGDSIYGYDDVTLESVVVSMLKAKGLTVATAESCTAGYISKRITDISGASEVFNMGISTYSNESKIKQLGVPAELIKENGAVSPKVAACMAKGVRINSGADIGLSITGIAGPKSDESNKPVGLAYIGLSVKDGEYVIKSMKGGKKDREYIRYSSASEALNFLRLYLLNGGENLKADKMNAVLLGENGPEKEAFEPPIVTVSELKDEEDRKNQIRQRALVIQNPVQLSPDEFTEVIVGSYDENDEGIESEAVSLESMKNIPSAVKKKSNFKVVIDESEYKPVEDDEFAEMDKAQEEFEKQLEKEKKKGFFKSMIIHKGDTKSEKGRKITFFVAIIVFLAMVANIAFYFINPVLQQMRISSMAEDYHNVDTEDYYSSELNPKFLSLYEKNSDIIGWITIDGTNIDYPVLQSDDAEYYMRRGFDKSYSREGSIFADNTSRIDYKNETQNIMLYGHHMVSTGTMFKELDKFMSVDFYKKHPNITFDSLYRDSEYKIFAVFITNALKSQDNGNFFNYMQTEFSSELQFENWINEARTRSMITTDVDIAYSDEILTLQTCNDSFESGGEKARLIIMARRVRDGEEKETDTSKAVKNANAKYPQMWYDVKGQANPYYNPDTTTATRQITVATSEVETTSTATSAATTSTTTAPNVAVYNPATQAQTVAKTTAKTRTTKTTTKAKTTKKTTTTTTEEVTENETVENNDPSGEYNG